MSDFENFEASPVTGLTDAIPNRMALRTDLYDVEYGIRMDDKSFIFHFYPPNTDWSEYPPKHVGKWADPNAMTERLELAIRETFDVQFVKGSYTAENQSFCIIVKGLGASPDPWFLAHRFFQKIDS